MAMIQDLSNSEELIKLLKAQFGNDRAGFEARLTEINAMGPDDRAEAIRVLGQDYKGQREGVANEMARNQAMLDTPTAKGGMAGNNQFSVYVGANPLEHLAVGANKVMGGMGGRKARADWDKSVADKTKANTDLMSAEANALRKPMGIRTPEEED